MNSSCLNVNNHSLIIDITWSSFFKKKLSYINVQLSVKRSLIITISHKHLFSHKWFFVRLSFSYHVSTHEIAYQKVKRLFFSLKSLIRCRSSCLMKCRSSDLMKYISSNLTRCRLIKFDEIARIKFDESLSSSLMSRFRRIWWVVSSSSCHFEKSN
jgi:hypothetical protein